MANPTSTRGFTNEQSTAIMIGTRITSNSPLSRRRRRGSAERYAASMPRDRTSAINAKRTLNASRVAPLIAAMEERNGPRRAVF
jgi:hypothetical protein